MKKMNPVVHFEMPAEDSKRMIEFYSNVFGDPVEIPGVGWNVSFFDTEANRVSLLQPNMR